MILQEFQAKRILARFGVAVPSGEVAVTTGEVRDIAQRLGTSALAVKAQIRAGGRGKAGGVSLVRSADLAEKAAQELLGRRLVTEQSGPNGHLVKRLLVEAGIEPARTLYLSLLIDASVGAVVLVASSEGGGEVEDRILSGEAEIERMQLGTGQQPLPAAEVAALALRLGLKGDEVQAFTKLVDDIRRAFVELDASLIEVNPLAVMRDGGLMALDVKIMIDDNALFRQSSLAVLRDDDEEAELEVRAQQKQLNYVRMDGNIGVAANGAGLGLATLDMVREAGGRPANFMDIRTTARSLDVAHGFGLLLDNPKVRVLLINVHGGGMQPCDVIVDGLGIAMRRTGRTLPTVVRLAGTNAVFARSRFRNFGCRVIESADMWAAATQAVAAAGR